jgi:hypothetical protein
MTEMTASLAEFNRKVNDVTTKLPDEKASIVVKKLLFAGLNGLVNKTPVDTGRARGNWQVTIGSPAEGENKSGDPIARGGEVIEKIERIGSGLFYISNNVPYIEALENGHSDQAPLGMLAVTLQELNAIL